MLARILGSRGLMSAAVILLLVAAAAIGLKVMRSSPEPRAYCADLPDSVGLYKGSAVTIMGVPVGRITDITPQGAIARVRFTVPANRKLPPDVGAVTVSDTLVADRKLALIGAEPQGPGWDARHCITKSLTPKSLSQTFDALAQLADQLTSARDPSQRDNLGAGLDALDRATAGTGDQLNAIVEQLSRVLAAPDAAIGHIGGLIDALSQLAHRAQGNWSTVQESVSGLAQTFGDINVLAIPQIVEIVAGLRDVLPQLNDVLMMFGTPAIRALDSITDLPRMIDAGVGSVGEIIRMAPAVASGFANTIDPATGQLTIRYTPPKIALPQQDTAQVCAAVQVVTGQPCPAGATTVPALPLLLGAVSAR
ncbi:MlaD family protein [Nocardia sp. NPDC004068]|uniref:MlaD family protein n=1 Tax=Nocardia sp. NPDC004068 TaxID=3364303 RepID=UPI003677E06E